MNMVFPKGFHHWLGVTWANRSYEIRKKSGLFVGRDLELKLGGSRKRNPRALEMHAQPA